MPCSGLAAGRGQQPRGARPPTAAATGAGDVGSGSFAAGSAQHGEHPGADLARAERLGEVVVGADLQADEPVDLLGAGGQHHDVGVGGLPDAAAHLDAVEVGQVEVEGHQVGVELGDGGDGVAAVGAAVDVEVGLAAASRSAARRRPRRPRRPGRCGSRCSRRRTLPRSSSSCDVNWSRRTDNRGICRVCPAHAAGCFGDQLGPHFLDDTRQTGGHDRVHGPSSGGVASIGRRPI